MKVKIVFLLLFHVILAIASATFLKYNEFTAPAKTEDSYQQGQIISVPCNPGFVLVKSACRKTFPGRKKVDFYYFSLC